MSFNDGPGTGGVAITPNDTTKLEQTARGIYVGGEGDISVLTPDGDTLLFVGVLAGGVLPIAARRVNATGTTATNLVGVY